jgi:protein arginine kinase
MIEELIKKASAKSAKSTSKASSVVISSRLRLARNLRDCPFPNRADISQKREILSSIEAVLNHTSCMNKGNFFKMEELSSLERKVLVERHWISRELSEMEEGSAVSISSDQLCSVMINEEDHLRIQFIKNGFNLNALWKTVNDFDDLLEDKLPYAFSRKFGYLTACPTNLGTGLRASVMMHLPGLSISDNIEKVIRASNQLGLAVRGLFGEGSDASGHIYQISNQQTLGESEKDILDRLAGVLKNIIEHELNGRIKYYENNKEKLIDMISRSYGILQSAHLIDSDEAMNHLSFIRMAIDLGFLPEEFRRLIDFLFIEIQPGHIQYPDSNISVEIRDIKRAQILRNNFKKLPSLNFDK